MVKFSFTLNLKLNIILDFNCTKTRLLCEGKMVNERMNKNKDNLLFRLSNVHNIQDPPVMNKGILFKCGENSVINGTRVK